MAIRALSNLQPDASRFCRPTTFGRSGHRAPQMSFKFFACLRGQSADISSDHSNSLASILSRSIRRVEGVTAEPTALLALDVENVEFADQISENNGAFTRHVEPPLSSQRALYWRGGHTMDLFLQGGCSASFNDRAAPRP
jgi:hypothetical protein